MPGYGAFQPFLSFLFCPLPYYTGSPALLQIFSRIKLLGKIPKFIRAKFSEYSIAYLYYFNYKYLEYKFLKIIVDISGFIRYNKLTKQKQHKQQEKQKEGGTVHRKQKEISHNLRKRGTVHQNTKITPPQSLFRGTRNGITFSPVKDFGNVKTEVEVLEPNIF